jgi:hypothetical protein
LSGEHAARLARQLERDRGAARSVTRHLLEERPSGGHQRQ